jgi:hypothetical protein
MAIARRSALEICPDALPPDEAVNIKATIEGMAKPHQPDTTS